MQTVNYRYISCSAKKTLVRKYSGEITFADVITSWEYCIQNDLLIETSMTILEMQYMEVFDKIGKRLFIKSSNAAILETKIENYDSIIKNVGERKIDLMLKKSSEDGIPTITLKYLSDNFITHPSF